MQCLGQGFLFGETKLGCCMKGVYNLELEAANTLTILLFFFFFVALWTQSHNILMHFVMSRIPSLELC